MDDESQLRLLPYKTRQLANTIGLAALRTLSDWRGGVTIYIPSRKNLHRGHELVSVIGWEAAQALATEEGRKLEVPRANQAMTAALQAEIRAYRATHSEAETALRFRVGARWVRRLMSQADKLPGPQTDLFGGEF